MLTLESVAPDGVFEVQNVVRTTGIVANMLLSVEANNTAETRCRPQPACKILSVLHRSQHSLETLVLVTPAHAVPQKCPSPSRVTGLTNQTHPSAQALAHPPKKAQSHQGIPHLENSTLFSLLPL